MKKILDAIRDENRSIHERILILFAAMALTAMFLVTVAGLFIGETLTDSLIMGSAMIIFTALIFLALKTKKLNLISTMIALIVLLALMPLVYFTGGGISGGACVWFVFCALFISMIIYGKIKYVLLGLEGVVVAACLIISYIYPELIKEHDSLTDYIGSYVSILVVGVMLSLMVGFEIRILKREIERSDEKSRRIEELNKSQNRFFSNMSHEIRTPINTIIGLNEMILREDTSDEVADDARNIQSASRILLSLINDILDMSKMESGKMEIVPVIYDVGKMLTEIVNMIGIRAREKGLEFTIDVDPTLPSHLLSDEVRIKQIIINLLNNAIKYTRSGSVSLSVHCRRTGADKALVTYSVEDTGIGIRKENIPYLFDAFRRVDEKNNRFIEGTGLGLAIVKQLVDLLGGEISVNSIYTQGSTFAVTIEQETVDDRVIGTFSPEETGVSGSGQRYHESFTAPKARVLIVDDNSANLLVAAKLLRSTKVMTETADSGEHCLKMTLLKHYDAILMDHMMPGMDGIECLHAIRAQTGGLCRETPVIILTANAAADNQALYRREGFDGYLVKPVEGEALEESLLNVLPPDMVEFTGKRAEKYDMGGFVRETRRKVPLMITTDSVSDLPKSLLDDLNIPVLAYKVYTDRGVFDDGLEADGDVLIRYMQEEDMKARSECPSVEEYEAFFAEQLSYAQHIVHIAMAKRSSGGFANASEAALAFYNVSVIDSGHLSSGMGLMVLTAKYHTENEQYTSADELRNVLDTARNKIQTSFIIDNTEYLRRSGRLSDRVNMLCRAFMVHPVIVMKDSSMTVGRAFLGSLKRARRKYIQKTLHTPETIDKRVLFITYVGMKHEEIEEIRDMAQEIGGFEKIYLQKASPAVSANCGAGTFGLLFMRK